MGKDIKRIALNLKSEDSKPLSGWQLQEFINNFSKGYTKLDLINEISRLINSGEKPENIIILNKSYNINNNSYTYLQKLNEIDLNKASMVENFYHLGMPTSIYPNKKIKEIEIIFSLYRDIYKIFNSENIPVIEKNRLKAYINLDIDKAIINIEKDSKEILNRLKIHDENLLSTIMSKLTRVIDSRKNKYYTYKNDKSAIIKFTKIRDIEFKKLEDKDKELYIKIQKRYYNDFFRLLRDVDRPIILTYDEKSNKLHVVKKEYMLNDVESDNFLDYKDYSHNSPFVITIIAGFAVASIVGLLYKGTKQEKINCENIEENRKIEESIDKNIKEIILELSNSPDLNQVDEIEDKFIKENLVNLRKKINENTEKTLERRGINGDNVVIDIEKYRNDKK